MGQQDLQRLRERGLPNKISDIRVTFAFLKIVTL